MPAAAPKSNPQLLYAACVGGMLVWLGCATLGGRSEAWDSPLYFSIGLPLLALLAAGLAYREPRRVWRFAFAPMAGQALLAFVLNPGANLLPLGLILFALLALPLWAAAALGARLSPYRETA